MAASQSLARGPARAPPAARARRRRAARVACRAPSARPARRGRCSALAPPAAEPEEGLLDLFADPKWRESPEERAARGFTPSTPEQAIPGAGAKKRLDTQEGLVDDLTLSNPLARLERLGTGWLGAVFDWEGVLVEDKGEAHQKAWLVLAEEESKRLPMKWELARADGMKAEQVISEVFCWARDPAEVRRLAVRKHRLVDALALAHERDTEPDLAAIAEDVPAAECERPVVRERPGVRRMLESLRNAGVPMTVGCCAPRDEVERGVAELGLGEYFEELITAEDVAYGKPDPECYLYAAQLLERPPVRCVVFGADNRAIEAARDALMKTVAVAGSKPHYELASADTVVGEMSELSVHNLKNLFSLEELRDSEEPELELEEEVEPEAPWTTTITRDDDDYF